MRTAFTVGCLLLLTTPVLRGQETIDVARELYVTANYEEALGVLSRLESPNNLPTDRLAIDQYRAFCFLALGRTVEAERAIEAVLSADPLYRPAEADASPRLRSAFASVRQRILPALVQREYANAKAAFDRQEFATAAIEFARVLRGLDDSALADGAGNPQFADLRTLAAGFRDLSVRAATPPPEPPPAPEPVAAPKMLKEIYGAGETGVSPPQIVRQSLPPFPRDLVLRNGGVLEVLINQAGTVESVIMRSSMNPRYDAIVVNAAKAWKYQPATVDGTPVKFRKLINISVKPGS
jgi:TonB family protein